MENTEQNGNNNPRTDRIERTMEMLIADHVKFADEHNKLLTTQVLLTADLQVLRDAQKQTDEQMKATDARLGILAGTMDTFIRERGDRR